jgi:hypothetical protein
MVMFNKDRGLYMGYFVLSWMEVDVDTYFVW